MTVQGLVVSTKAEVMRLCRLVCHSICLWLCVSVQPHVNSYAWIDMKFLSVKLTSLSFRGYSRPARSFRCKTDCSTEIEKRYGQSYYRTLIGSRMCFVQWRHSQRPRSTFQDETRRRYVRAWKTIHVGFWPWRKFAGCALWVFSGCKCYGFSQLSYVCARRPRTCILKCYLRRREDWFKNFKPHEGRPPGHPPPSWIGHCFGNISRDGATVESRF